jgi:hypothetical protein
MTLTDPRDALADQSDFIGYLVGLAGLAQVVHTLAADSGFGEVDRTEVPCGADDFVHALLGLASIGAAIERFANSAIAQHNPTDASVLIASATEASPPAEPVGWLR